MLKVDFRVKEMVASCKEIMQKPGALLQYVREDVRRSVGTFFEDLKEAELTLVLGRERYVRDEGPSLNRRKGYRESSPFWAWVRSQFAFPVIAWVRISRRSFPDISAMSRGSVKMPRFCFYWA